MTMKPVFTINLSLVLLQYFISFISCEHTNIQSQVYFPKCKDNEEYIFKRYISSPSSMSSISMLDPSTLKQNRTCKWVKKNPLKRCSLIDQDDIVVKDRCRDTCNNCNITVDTTVIQTRRIASNQGIGAFCLSNSDCASQLCKENTCFASDECKSIKHTNGQTFDKNVINLVFVGSGFKDLVSWRTAVARTFRAFDHHSFLGFENPRYNAFYVDEYSEESFCEFNCNDIETLLCCNLKKSKEISSKCFPNGTHKQTIVIENRDKYAGGGYRYQNVATTSTHELGPTVAVHELGHSLFDLGDEYTSSLFTANNAPNCDLEGCPKWADLDEHLGGGLCQTKGCQNGNYFIGETSFMKTLGAPMGHVNLRYTCCTFLALTKGTPAYCRMYDFGDGLLNFCKKDHQNYGGPQVYMFNGGNVLNDNSNGKFAVATTPERIILNLDDNSFVYSNSSEFQAQGPSLVQRREYLGDFPDLRAVCESAWNRIMEITLRFDSGVKQRMYFINGDNVDAPPLSSSAVKNETNIFVQSSTLEIIVEGQRGTLIGFKVRQIEITIWTRLRIWIISHFQAMFRWLFSDRRSNNTPSAQ